MIERIYILESVDPVIFCGVSNSNIQLIKTLLPKSRIVARRNMMKVIRDENESEFFLKRIHGVEKYCEEPSSLFEDMILGIIKGKGPMVVKQENLIIHSMNGKPVTARTESQQLLVKAFENNDLAFVMRPVDSGKMFAAIALIVRALENEEIRKIILSRPIVEAGKKLGFLPGEMKDKLDPYPQPLYDVLQDMIPTAKLKEYMENNAIRVASLVFMRGRTSSDTVTILDKAQDTTTHQIKMSLTRLGINAKMIAAGDVTQIDLPPFTTSGLMQVMQILKGVNGIGKIEFTKKDIIRHKLIQRIVGVYDKFDDKRKKEVKGAKEEKTNIDNN